MADCCQQLSSELTQLRAEVARLRPIDEEAIIQKAVERTKAKLLPFIDEALALANLAYNLAKTVEKIAKTAEAVAKAAEAIAKAVKPVLALVPLIPALITVAGLVGLILGFAARIANAEARISAVESGLRSLDSTVGSVINTVMRLQAQLNSLKLQKGDKGDRGLQGIPGYTPIKGIDYVDGKNGVNGIAGINGKDGYTPIKGKDYVDGTRGKDGQKGERGVAGKDGKTPRINVDYFNGKDGKDGYTPKKGIDYKDGMPGESIKGDRGSDGKPGYTPVKNKDYFDGTKGKDGVNGRDGSKGDRGSDGSRGNNGAPGARGERGLQGIPGKSEMPVNLAPVLNAIANVNIKVTKVISDSAKDRIKIAAIDSAVNVQIEGVVNVTPCGKPLETYNYSGTGLVGIQTQLITSANQVAKVHEDICKITTGIGSGVGTTPKASDLLEKIYAILGGDIFYPKGDELEPRFLTNAEVPIKVAASILFHEDGSEGGAVVCNNILDAINISNAVSYYRMGLHEFPASLPESLISKDDGFLGNLIPTENKDIHNLTRFLTWYIERFDEIMGQWEIPIEIKDSDPSKPGEQPLGIKLPNMAEAIAEMFTLCLQTNINSETMLNIATRTMAEVGADKQQNFVSFKLLQSLTDWVGFKQKDISLKMPLLFTLNKTRYDEILKESEVNVGVVEFDDKFGLEADLMRFREGVAILQATNKKKIDPKGDIKAQILKYLLDTYASTKKVNGDDDDAEFKQFLQDVEVGFTQQAGINDSTKPYGRDYSQRPRIRDLTKYEPPTP